MTLLTLAHDFSGNQEGAVLKIDTSAGSRKNPLWAHQRQGNEALRAPNEVVSQIVSVCPACEDASRYPTGCEAPGFFEVIGTEEFQQPNYFVSECAGCGLLYRNPCLGSAELARYYAAMDFRRWETSAFYPTERYTLEILRRLPAGSRILDFGCSSGRLLAPLCHEYQCYGVELNEAAAATAAGRGIAMIQRSEGVSPHF